MNENLFAEELEEKKRTENTKDIEDKWNRISHYLELLTKENESLEKDLKRKKEKRLREKQEAMQINKLNSSTEKNDNSSSSTTKIKFTKSSQNFNADIQSIRFQMNQINKEYDIFKTDLNNILASMNTLKRLQTSENSQKIS